MGLILRVKPKKRLPARNPHPLIQSRAANQSWSIDFMSDSLISGRAIRTLNIINDFNRETLWIEIDGSLPANRVVRVLEMIGSWRGLPQQIRVDNGPELISHRMVGWARTRGIHLEYVKPGKPTQNAYIERFNRTYREDVLDAYLFNSIEEALEITESCIEEYSAIHPHEVLGGIPPYHYHPNQP